MDEMGEKIVGNEGVKMRGWGEGTDRWVVKKIGRGGGDSLGFWGKGG